MSETLAVHLPSGTLVGHGAFTIAPYDRREREKIIEEERQILEGIRAKIAYEIWEDKSLLSENLSKKFGL